MTDLDTIIYVYDAEDAETFTAMSVEEFFDANEDGIDAQEQAEIYECLDTAGVYYGGGGAAGDWYIKVAA